MDSLSKSNSMKTTRKRERERDVIHVIFRDNNKLCTFSHVVMSSVSIWTLSYVFKQTHADNTSDGRTYTHNAHIYTLTFINRTNKMLPYSYIDPIHTRIYASIWLFCLCSTTSKRNDKDLWPSSYSCCTNGCWYVHVIN